MTNNHQMLKKYVVPILLGVATIIVSSNLLAFFISQITFLAAVTIVPLAEEVCKAGAIVLAKRRNWIYWPWGVGGALLFGAAFGGFELVLKWQIASGDPVGLVTTALFHAFLAIILTSETMHRGRIEFGVVAAVFWHALYNAWIFVRVEVGAHGMIESVVRLLVVISLISLVAPLARAKRPAEPAGSSVDS